MRLIISTWTICNQYKRSKCRGSGSVGQPTDPSRLQLCWSQNWTDWSPLRPTKENNVLRASLAGVKNRSNIFTLHFASLARDTRSLGGVSPPRGPFSLPTFLYFCCSCRTPCISFIVVGWLRKRRLTSLGALCLAKLNIFQCFFFVLFFFASKPLEFSAFQREKKKKLIASSLCHLCQKILKPGVCSGLNDSLVSTPPPPPPPPPPVHTPALMECCWIPSSSSSDTGSPGGFH